MSFVIEKETESICAYCGKIAETRPYGKDGADICFYCAMKNEKQTREIFGMLVCPSEGTMPS